MADGAILKIDRASKHIAQLNEMLRTARPFRYVVESNIGTGERATLAKRDEAVVDEMRGIVGDAIHNLRSALDHAYWQIVSSVVTNERERKAVQFPFSETRARLEEAVKNRLAHRISDAFFNTIMDLQPHGEAGGNTLLYLIHEIDLLDKHRLPTPMASYTRLSSDIIRRQVPDFPPGLHNVHFGASHRDVVWHAAPGIRGRDHILEKELDVPVDVIIPIRPPHHMSPMIPLLYEMRDMALCAIGIMRETVAA